MSKHEQIANSLTQDILVGQYRTGERLPSERDLASRFDANRGAVREAMKKLEQLGIADIQPGGARVTPLNEASLDVIGCLLALGDIPDSKLVAQILLVISSLVKTAAEAAVKRVNDDELEELCGLVRPLHTEDLNEEAYTHARIAMMQGIMAASGNLPVQLIAQSLLQQFVPQMAPLEGYGDLDLEAHRALAKQLDEAMGQRDLPRMGEVFNDFLELHQLQVQQAFRAYKQAQQEATQEIALS